MARARVYTACVDCLKDPRLYERAREILPPQRRESADRMKVESGKRLSAGAGLLLMGALADYICARQCGDCALPDHKSVQPGCEGNRYSDCCSDINHGIDSDPASGFDPDFGVNVGGDHGFDSEISFGAGVDFGSLRFELGEQGKPYLPDYPGVHFNLSHSGSRVMCIVAPGEAGCDVEVVQSRHVDYVIRCLTESEQRLARASIVDFFRIWTLKESILKLSGKGLLIPLNSFEVTLDPPGMQQSFIPGVVRLKEYDLCRREQDDVFRREQDDVSRQGQDDVRGQEQYCCSCAVGEGVELPEEMIQVDLRQVLATFA